MNVLIAETMSATNRGEAAILRGVREALGAEAGDRYSLCTATPDEDRREYGTSIRLVPDNVVTSDSVLGRVLQAAVLLLRHVLYVILHRMHPALRRALMPAPLWNAYEECDVVLIGHDNVLVGRMLFNLCGVVLVARALRKPAVVYAGTVGPFSDALTRALTGWLLRRVALVTLREPYSVETTRRLLGRTHVPIHVATDPAFLMPPAPPERVNEILSAAHVPIVRPLVGVTTTFDMARRYAASRGRAIADAVQDYFRQRAVIIDRLVEEHDVHAVLLPHCVERGPRRDDRLANAEVLRHIRHPERVLALSGSYSAPELKGIIARCRLLIGDRTHSLIAAASLAVPLVGMSSRITRTKTRGILGETMGLNEAIFDVETFKTDTMLATAAASLAGHERIRAELLGRLPAVFALARLPGQLVQEMLASSRRSQIPEVG